MKRSTVLIFAALLAILVGAARPAPAIPPPRVIPEEVLGYTNAVPHAGTSFEGAVVSLNPNAFTKVAQWSISCVGVIAANPDFRLRTRVKRFFSLDSGTVPSAISCSWRVPHWARGNYLRTRVFFRATYRDGTTGYGEFEGGHEWPIGR